MKELFSITLSILAPIASTIGAITLGLAIVAIIAAALVAALPLRQQCRILYRGKL